MTIKIHSISLKNILGLREWSLDTSGGATVITGANAAGKSSILKGLQTAIGGGSLAALKNHDAGDEKAEIVLVLDSDEDGRVIVKKTERNVSVKKQVGDSAAFEDVRPPQRWLDALFDKHAANPVTIITCSDKERVQLLIEALDLDYDHDALWERIGLDYAQFKYPRGLHPLKEIAEIRDAIFTERTGVNRDEKAKRATAEHIRRDIPATTPTVEDATALEARLGDLRGEYASQKAAANEAARKAKADAAGKLVALEAAKRAELERYEQQLRAEMAEKLAKAKSDANAALEFARTAYHDAHSAANDQLDEDLNQIDQLNVEINNITAELAELREQAKNAVRIETLREQADDQEKRADKLKAFSERLTAALQELDLYKADMVATLPIPGLDIAGNVVRVNGVQWGDLNTGEQIKTAVRVACLRLADKPFRPVFVDGAEALDAKNLKTLIDELAAAGAQPFIARVGDDELKVEAV